MVLFRAKNGGNIQSHGYESYLELLLLTDPIAQSKLSVDGGVHMWGYKAV